MSRKTRMGTSGATPSVGGRTRRVGIFVAVVVVVAVVLALITGVRPTNLSLDPDDAGPHGGLALVEVLRQHGVDVSVVRSSEQLTRLEGPATLVLGNPEYLGEVAAERVRWASGGGGVRVVLVMPTAAAMSQLGYPIKVLSGSSPDPLTGRCATTAVAEGDRIGAVSPRLVPATGATGCFPYPVPNGVTVGSSGYAMVTIPANGRQPEIIAAGLGEALSNQQILDADNAGVAVRLLGNTSRLVWYQPDITDLGATTSTVDPWPAWQWPAAWVVGLAFVLFAVAIGRRLGRLVPEPLPVVVKASETTEARARLYQRTHDRGRAATILRYGTIRRLRRRLGSDAPAGALTAEASLIARASDATGLPPTLVADWLAGPLPASDDALIQFSQHLADLEEKATRR